jgi:hypothetical protein
MSHLISKATGLALVWMIAQRFGVMDDRVEVCASGQLCNSLLQKFLAGLASPCLIWIACAGAVLQAELCSAKSSASSSS